jgi:hypothetical protein
MFALLWNNIDGNLKRSPGSTLFSQSDSYKCAGLVVNNFKAGANTRGRILKKLCNPPSPVVKKAFVGIKMYLTILLL